MLCFMVMKLELIAVAVSDADPAKSFYTERAGFLRTESWITASAKRVAAFDPRLGA
jgi:hypothetical protein